MLKKLIKNFYFISILISLLLFQLNTVSIAQKYESVELINSINFANIFERYLGYLYDSHGCLHFTPSDIYLLYQTISKGTKLTIMPYSTNKTNYKITDIPFFNQLVNSKEDIKKYKTTFSSKNTELIVYPSLNVLIIINNNKPIAKINLLAGPKNKMRYPIYVEKGQKIIWDPILAGPTTAGEYTIYGFAKDYVSNTYRQTTIIPFGAEIKKEGKTWVYSKKGKKYKVPAYIEEDLTLPLNERTFNYFDIKRDKSGKIISQRWGSHDFGKYVMLWTKDGKRYLPEMGYAEGELLYEQTILIDDLARILSMRGIDDFDKLVEKNENFSFYKELYEFISSKGKKLSSRIDPTNAAYYKLFKGYPLTKKERSYLDDRIVSAYKKVKENNLPFIWFFREQTLGLYNYLKMNALVFEKYAGFYENVLNDWEMWKKVRIALRNDFSKANIISYENRKEIIEKIIHSRLEFNTITTENINFYEKYSIDKFFQSDEESEFAKREKEEAISIIAKGEIAASEDFKLFSVDALNNYNFGVLLNEILGNLYKSHGCLHVSPRDAFLLYNILPINTKIVIRPYGEQAQQTLVNSLPTLASLADVTEDLNKIKEKIKSPKDIEVVVFPSSGQWIIYLNNLPFAKLSVLGGPKEKMRRVEYRDADGTPIFSDKIAYPTTPGTFYVLRKVENYVSNLYRDTTIVPMGSKIKKVKNSWVYEDEKGLTKPLPKVIVADLEKPLGEQEFHYYDIVQINNKIIEARWSSHEFGKYSIITTKDRKTMWPELIHTSGELMFEQRKLVEDLIKLLSTPKNTFDECVSENINFDLYRECYNFVNNPQGETLLSPLETARYKLYFGIPLNQSEEAVVPKDAIIANKIVKNLGHLTNEEINYLIKIGVARKVGTQPLIDMLKIKGIDFETYQNVVVIQKFAHHYEVLKNHWNDLSQLREAMFNDFRKFLIRDKDVFNKFISELMMVRIDMEKVTPSKVSYLIFNFLNNQSSKENQ